MKLTRKRKVRYIIAIASFTLTAIIIALIFPSVPKFKYDYQKGKPWAGDLLVAPFDFPIHKSPLDIIHEQEEIERTQLLLYYTADTKYEEEKLKLFQQECQSHTQFIKLDTLLQEKVKKAIEQQLKKIYQAGIISSNEWNRILESGKNQIAVTQNKITQKRNTSILYTPKSAYNSFHHLFEDSISQKAAQLLNLNHYIGANLIVDLDSYEKVKVELLRNISLYRGKVQSGEKIINTGEIVSDHLFNILSSLEKEFPLKMGSPEKRAYILSGHLIIICFICALLFFYMFYYRNDILINPVKIAFILSNMLIFLAAIRLSINYTWLPIYALPIIIYPILLRIFFDSRTAIFAFMSTLILAAGIVPTHAYNFIVIQLFTGIVAVYSLKKLTKRADLLRVSVVVFTAYSILFTAISLTQEGSLSSIDWFTYIYLFINAGLLLFVYPIIFVYEKMFGFVSDVTLMELSDSNRSLLQQLSERAPGTFFHSIQISNLVQAAAIRIDANPLLARTGALYHDIGKLENPMYFTENQQGIPNPHDQLDYEESARIIINHVSDGERLARKHNLPQQIIDFITSHHGIGKAMYFYTSFKNAFPDREIDEAAFTYPGPLPNSKETALLMMADAIEATSRSLKEHTEEAIDELVERIVNGQLKGGCFDHAPINFREIQVAKETFKQKLMIMYHTRVAYPKANKKKEGVDTKA